MISHRNVIANVLQIATFELSYRLRVDGVTPVTEIGLGLLPQSHIYALVVIAHAGAYRGDQTIVLPKFELNSYLNAIQQFKITSLYLVSIFVGHIDISNC
jgi:acyl-CoA synthetase (AMP-forming)/AMP-acid ligase II